MQPTERFSWEETEQRLTELAETAEPRVDDERRAFTARLPNGARIRLTPPLVQAIPADVSTAAQYLDALSPDLELRVVMLVQAGAAALGLYSDGELIRHKAFKKYVTRGNGRYQGTHLKTKGKSRYGSRLRLQNARSFLEEVNERLAQWIDEEGEADVVHYSCPVRLWADLRRAKVAFPFDEEATPLHKIPLHVHVPTHEELRRVWYEISHGTIEHQAVEQD